MKFQRIFDGFQNVTDTFLEVLKGVMYISGNLTGFQRVPDDLQRVSKALQNLKRPETL